MVSTRQLVLPTSETGPLPEVRVAPGGLTTIVFDAALVRDSVTLDGEGTRIRRVDTGDTSVTVEPLEELGGKRALLRVRFVDGAAPAEATLVLVSDPVHVDSHVRVSRPAHCAEELAEVRARCEAREVELAELRARCEANGLVGLVLAGLLGRDDLTGASWLEPRAQENGASGVRVIGESWVKVAEKWMLLVVRVKNGPGQPPWSPDKVTLRSAKTNEAVGVLVVRMDPPQLGSGEAGLVAVEAEPPSAATGEHFLLELRETASGRHLSIPFKALIPKAPGGKDVKP